MIAAAALVAVIVAAVVVFTAVSTGGRTPEQTVRDLFTSVEDVDCELYESVTTDFFRGGITADTCASSNILGIGVVGATHYALDVRESSIDGATATVTVWIEISGDSIPVPFQSAITFGLVRENNEWKINSTS